MERKLIAFIERKLIAFIERKLIQDILVSGYNPEGMA